MVGGTGVLLPDMMADFGVNKATIGLLFFAYAGGYVVSASANGALLHRLGLRAVLLAAVGLSTVAAGGLVAPTSFPAVLGLQVLLGTGGGVLDAAFNSHLSTLERPALLLNLYHGFFGIGALCGPLVAAYLIDRGFSWHAFFALLAGGLAVTLAGISLFPRTGPSPSDLARPRLSSALRLRAVLIAAAFLAVYVGLESAVGNWAFSYLTEERGQGVVAAGWVVSGYWLGLSVGRLTVAGLAARIGLTVVPLFAVCIAVVGLATLVVWVLPWTPVTTTGMVLLGFFLGPIFPTMIATLPRLVPGRLVATTIGVLAATSLLGAAVFPWLVGAFAERVGLWVLLPWTAACAGLLGLLWWRVAVRLAPAR
jgi:fucose permease